MAYKNFLASFIAYELKYRAGLSINLNFYYVQ